MIQRLLILIGSVVFFGGCATTGSIEKISPNQKVAVISAIDPVMRGHKLGFTIFEIKNWTAEHPGFDVNAVVLNAVKVNLNRDAKLVNGKDVGLLLKNEYLDTIFIDSPPAGLTEKLTALGREWQVDLIILIQTTTSDDWIGETNQRIEGFGHYARFSFGRNLVYGAFWVSVFDCKTGQFTGGDAVQQSRLLPDVSWHDSWSEYTPEEQRTLTREFDALARQSVPIFLSEAGLTDTKIEQRSVGSFLLNPNGPTQSYVPEGNELEIPAGVSRQAARLAIVNGLKDNEWVLTTDTVDRMVGVYREGKKEAICTFTFTDHSILMAPEGHEIQDDGQRLTVEYYHGWHKDLKESIVEALMKTPPDIPANTPVNPATP
jgi:hypothetical protein